MADLGSCDALKVSINGKIFTNTTFEVSAEDIRSAFEDTIDTLCGNVNVIASYADLSTLVSTSKLAPGDIYVFPYETVSLVGSAAGPMLNTSVSGYTPIVEQLAIVAKDENSFFNSARSINYPEDIIMYDFTDDTEPTTSTSRSGLIYYRKDTKRDIETFFDFRNNYVARYDLSPTGVEITATQAVTKGDVIYYNVAGSTVAADWYFVNIDSSDVVADAEANADILTSVTDIEQSFYPLTSVDMGNSAINVDVTSVVYSQSIGGTCDNIKLSKGTTNVFIINSSQIEISSSCHSITLFSCNAVSIGKSSSAIVCSAVNDSDFEISTQDVYVFTGSSISLGKSVSKVLSISSDCVEAGTNSTKIVSVGSSSNNKVGCGCDTIFFTTNSEYNVLGDNNANITIFKGNNNTTSLSCSSIQIYGGSNNRFAQSCTLINMLGDRDEALGLGTSYISPYSKMDNNTFGSSCENITFENVGGRGNTFGDECANLVFTNTASNVEWRLVGCDFCRGIRNKTFEDILHGSSFIVPNAEVQTITSSDWYVPALYVGATNPNEDLGTGIEADGDRIVSNSTGLNNYNRISVGYERAGWFFDSANASEGVARRATLTAGVNENLSSSEYRLYGPPTNKAFQWTHNGFPLLINFINGNVQGSDPTSDLTT